MRYLKFSPTDNGNYNVLYDGIISSDRPVNGAEARVVAGILTEMERVGVPRERGGMASYTIGPAGGVVPLEDVQYKLVKELLDNVRFIPKFAKEIALALEWFENAPTIPFDASETK